MTWTQTVLAKVIGIGMLALIYAMSCGLIGAMVLLTMVALPMYLACHIDRYAYVPMTAGAMVPSPPPVPSAVIMERS